MEFVGRKNISRRKQFVLIILCWAAYTIAYLGRYSYNSNGVPIKRFYGVENDEFSLATTFFFFAYGAGQIINGLLCRRYPMKYAIAFSLIISAAINLSVFLGLPFYLIKYAWLINGICQSVLWSSLMRILSCYLDADRMKTAVIAMSTTVSIGTFLAYGASALFALFDGFVFSFLLAAVSMAAVGTAWLFTYGAITENTRLENAETVSDDVKETEGSGNGTPISGLLAMLAVFGLFAVVTNFVKDGLTTWVPLILNEKYGLNDSLSIILTLVLPLFAIFGAVVAVWLNRRVRDHSDLVGVLFFFASACVAGIVILLKTELWYAVLALFGAVNMFAHGSNNVITSIMPLYVGKKYNAGLVAGVLNGACYVGSTASQYVIAAIATASGWNTVMITLLLCCIAATAASVLLFARRKIRKRPVNEY